MKTEKNKTINLKELSDNLKQIHDSLNSYLKQDDDLALNSETTRIIINARGVKFDVVLDQLDSLPNSRLTKLKNFLQEPSNLDEIKTLCDDYNLIKNEFYFNKDPHILGLILNFYASNGQKIHLNFNNTIICPIFLVDEFKYWNIESYEDLISPCCLRKLEKEREDIQDDLDKETMIIKNLNYKDDFGKCCLPKVREIIWNLIEKPQSSVYAKIYMVFSFAMLILSTLDLILRTIPELNNASNVNAYSIIEIICISWYTFEFILRFTVCPSKLKFIKSPLNISEFCSIVPYYFYLIFQSTREAQIVKNISRIFRTFSLFKVVRFSLSLRVLVDTLKNSAKEIAIYLIYLTVGVLTFSSLLYYVEYAKAGTKFTSIPATFWWAIITMTTVGYGDMYPESIAGKIFAGLCAICGVIIIAMPVGLLSANFAKFYELDKRKAQVISRLKLREEKKGFFANNKVDIIDPTKDENVKIKTKSKLDLLA